jgi:hypothetical protein
MFEASSSALIGLRGRRVRKNFLDRDAAVVWLETAKD